MSDRVAKWLPVVERYCPDLDPTSVLALIHVESAGDEFAHRPFSQFHGLLQMGRAAGIDVGLPDKGRKTTEPLSGDGEFAIDAFSDYVKRYGPVQGVEIAILWKGGPGYLKYVRRQDMPLDEAIAAAGRRFGFSATAYVARWRKALELYR